MTVFYTKTSDKLKIFSRSDHNTVRCDMDNLHSCSLWALSIPKGNMLVPVDAIKLLPVSFYSAKTDVNV